MPTAGGFPSLSWICTTPWVRLGADALRNVLPAQKIHSEPSRTIGIPPRVKGICVHAATGRLQSTVGAGSAKGSIRSTHTTGTGAAPATPPAVDALPGSVVLAVVPSA